MNIIGLVFAGVVMFALIFFGLGASQTLYDDANINETDEMYDNYNTSQKIAEQTFGFMGYLPYLLIITALLGALMLLAKVMT